MKKKSNGVFIVIIILLLVVVLCLVGYVCYDKGIIFNSAVKKDNKESNDVIEKENIKIDNTKDYVYDAEYSYDNQYTEFKRGNEDGEGTIDKFGIPVTYYKGMQFLSNLKVPYININSVDAVQVNKYIEMLYLKNAEMFDFCAQNAEESSLNQSCSQILTYRVYNYNNILSVVVIDSSQSTSAWRLNYNIYNFDLNDGSLLNYNDVIKKLNYNSQETLSTIKNLLNTKLDSLYGSFENDFSKACHDVVSGNNSEISCYDKSSELLENSINNNSILFFVNDKGNLNILAIPYYDSVENGTENKFLFEIKKN